MVEILQQLHTTRLPGGDCLHADKSDERAIS
jgi:hypothetical protein